MSTYMKNKLRLFQVAYKRYYHELSEWSCDYVRARDTKDALRIFGNRHRIRQLDVNHAEDWRWWDGECYLSFRFIRETTQKPKACPHCQGTGFLLSEMEV